ncbi:serine/threonine protein kinase [Gimesia panareensis]|uniref:serine/threonine protein kinase n=1 Tax=Gimesia panareensis TaxID=2527978 RepID=UPI001189D52B|nr:serine/threonine-protein kinase [Gimesia panareensis]QDU49515.1 Serine/threonine-protein kinase PrkC [Gimesia panareensis]
MSQAEDNLTNTFIYRSEDQEDSRVIEISREYLSLLEAGKNPDKAAFIERYPELSEIISECLEGIDLAHSLSQHLTPQLSEMMSRPLGDFKIIREIGRGGMATVYEATQLSLGRRVALKVLPFAASLDECQRQRFQIESQAAANLHHTNIVPVYAVGSERGMHYYAMQLIEGESLSEWLVRQKQELSGSQRTSLKSSVAEKEKPGNAADSQNHSTQIVNPSVSHTDHRKAKAWYQTIARIIAQVATGLEYAHQSGVVHRDIKPANLLIDVKGNAWITDFGLAQVSASSSVTRTGDVVGTLRYMSPEQLSGKRAMVDQRTDIYSLGATLYELLCLQPVFAANEHQQLLHNVLYDEPKPLRQVDRLIPVELETIVMKALAKVPGERYQSAAELAEDLQRFLDERPILARRPTYVDHGRKWLRRHPAVVVSSFVILLLGMVGLSVAMAAISEEERNTRAALNRESIRAHEAEQRLVLAQQAADDMIALAEFELSDNPFNESLRKKLLESALAHYQAVIKEQSDNPAALEKLRETRDRIEKILSDLIVLQADRYMHLMVEPDVLSDLGITPEQNQKIHVLFDWRSAQMNKTIGESKNLSASSEISKSQFIQNRRVEESRLTQDGLNAILTKSQQKRLQQLSLRYQGAQALHETEVIQALNLSNAQRMAMRVIESEYHLRGGPRGGGPRGGPPEKGKGPDFHKPERDERKRGPGGPPPKKMVFPHREPRHWENDPEQLEHLLKVLTPEQRQKWETLIGPPFKGDFQEQRDFSPGKDAPDSQPAV